MLKAMLVCLGLVIVLAGAPLGCSQPDKPTEEGTPPEKTSTVTKDEYYCCPDCKDMVADNPPDKELFRHEDDEQSIYFYCEGCKKAYDNDREAFLERVADNKGDLKK